MLIQISLLDILELRNNTTLIKMCASIQIYQPSYTSMIGHQLLHSQNNISASSTSKAFTNQPKDPILDSTHDTITQGSLQQMNRPSSFTTATLEAIVKGCQRQTSEHIQGNRGTGLGHNAQVREEFGKTKNNQFLAMNGADTQIAEAEGPGDKQNGGKSGFASCKQNLSESQQRRQNLTPYRIQIIGELQNYKKKQQVFATFAPKEEQQELPLPYFNTTASNMEPIEFDRLNVPQTRFQFEESYNSNFPSYEPENAFTRIKIDTKYKEPEKNQNLTSVLKSSNKEIVPENTEDNAENILSKNKGKMMEAECKIKASKNQWKNIVYRIADQEILMQQVIIHVKDIEKIKLYPCGFQVPRHNTLKMSLHGPHNEELFFAIKKANKWAQLPLPYQTFARLVIKKLKYFGIKDATEWEPPLRNPKIFLKLKKQQNKSAKMIEAEKLNQKRQRSKSKQQISRNQKHEQKIARSQTTNMSRSIIATFIHGYIYKKSYHLGKWQKRYTIINETGVYSYRNEEDQAPSIKIERNNVKYMWTWFSIIQEQKKPVFYASEARDTLYDEQIKINEYSEKQILVRMAKCPHGNKKNKEELQVNKYLIVKLKHGFNDQTQFAIPISNFDIASGKSKNWLFAFYRVMPTIQKSI